MTKMCVQQGPLILGKQEVGIDFDLSIYFYFEPQKMVCSIYQFIYVPNFFIGRNLLLNVFLHLGFVMVNGQLKWKDAVNPEGKTV